MANGWDWIDRITKKGREGDMKSSDLALEVIYQVNDLEEEILRTQEACIKRVMGVGDQQYSIGSRQKFEDMPMPDLLNWANEELEDVIVYAVMLRIRLARLKDAFNASFEAYRDEYLKEDC